MQTHQRFLDHDHHTPSVLNPLERGAMHVGELLVDAGHITRAELREALARKYRTKAKLGHILLENDLVTEEELAHALARQWHLGVIDLSRRGASPQLLTNVNVQECLRVECIPWRSIDGIPIIAISDPGLAEEARIACGFAGKSVAFAIATRGQIFTQIERCFSGELEQAACLSCPAELSARNFNTRKNATIASFALMALIGSAFWAPATFFWVLFTCILAVNLATAAFRIALVCAKSWPAREATHDGAQVTRFSDHRDLPFVSIMIGLLNEDLVLPSLLTHLSKLDYPPELLEIVLMLEEGDEVTLNHLNSISPARPFNVIVTPRGTLKTKPRALNYGLNFCRGEIVGVLDAEDRPEPGQIKKVVETLYNAPPDVACVQGVLDFYNARRNWFSRCFTMEYAIWFRVLLKGMQRLNLPIPLGGTTVYFRRRILEKVGGWDAHNVTEDADLGIRLYRFGYRTEVMSSTTMEEANSRVLSWIKQRSRWIKGYMVTWATHIRRPIKLFRELGPIGFVAFNLILLGGVSSYLSIPVLWALWIGVFGFDLQANLGGSDLHWQLAFASMLIGQAVTLWVAINALKDDDKRFLLPWVFTLPVYWPIGAISAFKALYEVFFAPYYWDKTKHGDQSDQITENETPPNPLMETENSPAVATG